MLGDNCHVVIATERKKWAEMQAVWGLSGQGEGEGQGHTWVRPDVHPYTSGHTQGTIDGSALASPLTKEAAQEEKVAHYVLSFLGWIKA